VELWIATSDLRKPSTDCPATVRRGFLFLGPFEDDVLTTNFTKYDGLVPAVIQDDESGEVLMVGFMNEAALAQTRNTGFATFFSRSRQTLWMKGETSGNKLAVQRILIDCDDDTLLIKVKRLGDGNVCHTGERTCFFRDLQDRRAESKEHR
jgi:phosphoribosyl-AMP cyclohydrolase